MAKGSGIDKYKLLCDKFKGYYLEDVPLPYLLAIYHNDTKAAPEIVKYCITKLKCKNKKVINKEKGKYVQENKAFSIGIKKLAIKIKNEIFNNL